MKKKIPLDLIKNLRLMTAAIRAKNGSAAEHIAREEVSKAAEEVMRLIAAEQGTD